MRIISGSFRGKKILEPRDILTRPLKDLTTNWKFEEINSSSSKIKFNVNFEFKNIIHQKVAETFYPLIENKMINSFKERANSF